MKQTEAMAPERRILAALASLNAPVRATVLRDKAETDGSGTLLIGVLYAALDRLGRQGCVLASLDPADQTKHLFKITSEGLSLLHSLNDGAAAVSAGPPDFVLQMLDLLDEMSEKDEEVLVAIGNGMLWSRELDAEARALAEKVEAELAVWRNIPE
jgi:DNA-binding PadR family transcriptional regulator